MLPYSPSDINSCYSYVSAGRKSKTNGGRALPSLLFVFFDSYHSFLSVKHREDYERFEHCFRSSITNEQLAFDINNNRQGFFASYVIRRNIQRPVEKCFMVTLKKTYLRGKIHDRKRGYFILLRTLSTTIRRMRKQDCHKSRLVQKHTFLFDLWIIKSCCCVYILMHKYVSVGIFQRMKRRGGSVLFARSLC